MGMEETTKRQDSILNTINFEFETRNICIATKSDELDPDIYAEILKQIFRYPSEVIEKAILDLKKEDKRVLIGPFATDVAKSFTYEATCLLARDAKFDDYVVYIKED